MKIHKYLARETTQILVDGKPKPIACYGGSDLSLEDAKKNARENARLVERKIGGDRKALESYEVEIREEIVETLSPSCIVTRNRYGALVLNSAETLFIDIDSPPWSWSGLFAPDTPASRKERIVKAIRRKAKAPRYRDLTLRIYETCQGIRVIVLGARYSARSAEANAILKELHGDSLYRLLCNRQNCFRARLTPKPHRIGHRRPGSAFPRESAEDLAGFTEWLAAYEQKSAPFAVCRHLETIGYNTTDRVVQYHDQMTRSSSRLKLA